MNPKEQSRIFADYYEHLAVPSNEEGKDEEYLENSKYRLELMNNIISHQIDTFNITLLSEEEIIKAVDKLNSGKTADEWSLTAEHFIYAAGRSISINIMSLFNNIMQTGEIPNVLKTEMLTPVHKTGTDSTLPQKKIRGISVTSALGKVFEYALLDKMIDLDNNQSELQFEFTQELSPIIAALLVSEGIVHAKQQNLNMFLATLDSQKAFDVVHHMILMDKLFYELPPDIWRVVQDLFSNMSSKIKWNSQISKQFSINQGVRQGGILSTHLYKLYINEQPEELDRRGFGLNIGLEYCESSLCADDIVIMSRDETEIHAMLNIAYKFSCQHRYNIYPKIGHLSTREDKHKQTTTSYKSGRKTNKRRPTDNPSWHHQSK
ncbi:Hypothetical predicted protein [Mytilus galloprovincialis]|uniref:Reverse transcriptase domain-containing protein n=1 Tax=Mytilus galloprovincialis TaxID=29158 RepID=A0A8B6DMR0_MYTGA|nr:Hypothetical predicted protein [Mytilus galloprovincialis]